MRWHAGSAALILAAVAGSASIADSALAADIPARPAAPNWTITLGVEGRYLPTFEGNDRFTVRPFGLINVRRAGTIRPFQSPRDGFSAALLNIGKFQVGPTLKFKWARREKDDPDLAGLGTVNLAVEPGLFAEYWPQHWLRTRAELRQGVGGHHGLVGDLSADLVVPVGSQLTLSAGPRVSFVSAEAIAPYYGVTAAQSAASGLPVYDTSSGVKAYGIGAQARYEWTPRWATHVFIEYDRLSGSAARSPLVTLRGDPNQAQVGIGLTYSFDIRGLW